MYLVKVSTNLDLGEAVNWLRGQGVHVISTSLGWYNLTPGDGTGYFADLVSQARADGIFWATAAGNDREAHWGGPYSDPDGDGFHNFSGTQEVNYFGPGDGSAYSIPEGYLIRVFVRWDDWTSVNQDFDLYLVRWTGSDWSPVASSMNYQAGEVGQMPTEAVTYVTSGASTAYGVVIERFDATRDVNFELFAPKVARLDESVPARSLANLADAPEAVTVAALDVNSPFPQESYSSEGPTNGPGGAETGGAVKSDLAGFANVSTVSYGTTSKFNGTSAATPHVAGTAALALGANPGVTPSQLRSFLVERAADMGPAGKDNQFGFGRLYLDAPPATKLVMPIVVRVRSTPTPTPH